MYSPPKHIGIVLHGKLPLEDVSFAVEAVRKQVVEHACPAWGWTPPGVFAYAKDDFVPASEGALVSIVDDDGNDETAGFHGALGNMPYGLVDLSQSASMSRTLSHEVLEILGNQFLAEWSPGPDGLDYAMELCDPVQEDGYEIEVDLFGAKRRVMVSDFVLPAWFGIGPTGYTTQWEAMGSRDPLDQFEIAPGGYQIAKKDGRVLYLAHPDGAFMGRSKTRKTSRTWRLTNA